MALDNLISLSFTAEELATLDQALQTIETVYQEKPSTLPQKKDNNTEVLRNRTNSS